MHACLLLLQSKLVRTLLLLHLPDVELQLLSFKNVSISASALSWTTRNAGIETTNGELVIKGLVQLAVLVSLSKLTLHVVALLRLLLLSSSSSSSLLNSYFNTIVLLIPLLEWSSIYLHDGVLHQGLGTDQLVIGGIVHDIQNTGLTSGGLRSPREISSIETEGTEL